MAPRSTTERTARGTQGGGEMAHQPKRYLAVGGLALALLLALAAGVAAGHGGHPTATGLGPPAAGAPGGIDSSAARRAGMASPAYTFPAVHGDDEGSGMRGTPTAHVYVFPEVYGDDGSAALRGVPTNPAYQFPAVYGNDEAR